MNTSPSYQKAVALRTGQVIYCRKEGRGRSSDWETVNPETGAVEQMTNAQFRSQFVPEGELPPHVRHIADTAPSWWTWKAKNPLAEKRQGQR